jgi:hypothetical protein
MGHLLQCEQVRPAWYRVAGNDLNIILALRGRVAFADGPQPWLIVRIYSSSTFDLPQTVSIELR